MSSPVTSRWHDHQGSQLNRSVLIITPFFAPQNHAAVFRAYKLAKYLPRFGWKPVVLTVDTHYEYNEDPGLLTQLPKETELIRARYLEPTLRGVRMALGGRDRTFKAMKEHPEEQTGQTAFTARAVALRAYHYAIKTWLHTPDNYWTWARTAIPLASKIVKQRKIDLVFTTAPPFSSLVIGQALHRNGAKWVADLRDPLTYTRELSSEIARIHHRQKSIVRHTLANADAVTLAAESMVSIYRDMFGASQVDPVFIPTGIDESLFEAASSPLSSGQPYLLFAGEILPEFDTVFWETFAEAATNPAVKNAIKILVVGTLALNRPRLRPFLDRFSLHGKIDFHDQMSQTEIYKLLQKARAGLLVPGVHSRWWTNAAKMTDFIGMRKPVVAVVPDPSEARTALTRSRLGIFLDGSLQDRVKTLTDFVLGKREMPEPDENYCARYTAVHQVRSFADLFDSVVCAERIGQA